MFSIILVILKSQFLVLLSDESIKEFLIHVNFYFCYIYL